MKNANKKFSDTEIRVNCRFSYLHVLEKAADMNGNMVYSATIMVDKDDATAVKLLKEAQDAAMKQFHDKFGAPKGKLKTIIRDGDEEKPDDENFRNKLFINAKSAKKQPGVQVLDGGIIADALDESEVYSGMYGAANIHFYPYSNKGSCGVACGLDNVIKLEDGVNLGGGGRTANAAFADLAD